jgi:hypothetical protein
MMEVGVHLLSNGSQVPALNNIGHLLMEVRLEGVLE